MSQMSDRWYLKTAKTEIHKDGEVEIDSNAIVSRGADDGAYVQAWVWVADPADAPKCSCCHQSVDFVQRHVKGEKIYCPECYSEFTRSVN